MKITESKLRKVIRKAITESLFKSKDSHSGAGQSAGDDRYWDLARAYHQIGGETVGGRQMDTVPSDKEEVISAIESCQEYSKNWKEEKGYDPPTARHSDWPQMWLDENPGVNITMHHLYFIADWCRMEVIPAYGAPSLLDKIKDDKRFRK